MNMGCSGSAVKKEKGKREEATKPGAPAKNQAPADKQPKSGDASEALANNQKMMGANTLNMQNRLGSLSGQADNSDAVANQGSSFGRAAKKIKG